MGKIPINDKPMLGIPAFSFLFLPGYIEKNGY